MENQLDLFINRLDIRQIQAERKQRLQEISTYIREKLAAGERVHLVFICTHNSRRSVFSQVWAQVMAEKFGLHSICSFSAGTEATAVYPGVIDVLARQGFLIQSLTEGCNPIYVVQYGESAPPLVLFSKTTEHLFNPKAGFAVVMTCSSADEGCPYVPGSEQRFSLPYEDPKYADGTEQEKEIYTAKSEEIATEMKYMFELVTATV